MNLKKINSVFLSLLLAFSLTSSAFAAPPVLNVDNKLILNKIDGGTASASGNTVNITAIEKTVYSEWGLFNHANGYIVNFIGDATFLNKVLSGNANFAGTLNAIGANANVLFSCLNGAIINQSADINVTNSFIISTLNLKETDIAKIRTAIENNKKLELVADNPNGPIRYGILIEDGAQIKSANRIDFASSMIINEHVSPAKFNNTPVYSTTDGIVFNLENNGAVKNIASTTPVPAGKMVPINGIMYNTPQPPPSPTPKVTDASPADPLLPLDKLQNQKIYTPTSLNNDLTGMPHNLAGVQMEVAPLEETKLVNNINPNDFSKNSVGAIAMNDSVEHTIATIPVSDLTPIGAASQVGNTGADTEENYDFIIPTAIIK